MASAAPVALAEMPPGLRLALTIISVGLVLAMGAWAIYDVFDHTDYGIVWLVAFLVFPPLLPIYIVMALYSRRSSRPAGFDGGREFSLSSEIDRARYIEASQDGRGTLYEPPALLGGGGLPRQAFHDNSADEMLEGKHYDEAAAYLTEMLELARVDGDPDRISTYRWYLSQLPGGRGLAALKAVEGEDGLRQANSRSLPF